MTDANCIFCAIAAGDMRADKVHEDDRTVALMDINPSARGHVLVIPKRHSTDLHDVDADDLAACMRTVQRVAASVIDTLGADGVNVLNNTGRAAGQVVFHFHVHVIPRYDGDGFANPLTARAGDPDEIARAAAALRGAIDGE